MKKLLHTLLLTLIVNASFSQIHTGNVYLSSQEDVDNFQAMYPDITYIEGTLEIASNPFSPEEIINLEGLSSLTGANDVVIYSRFLNGWSPQSINNLTVHIAPSVEELESYLGFVSFQEGLTEMEALTLSLDFALLGIVEMELFPNLISVESLDISGIGSYIFPSLTNCTDFYYYPNVNFELTLPGITTLSLLYIDVLDEVFLGSSLDPSIPNIEHIDEIMFSPGGGSVFGFFDGINNLYSCHNFIFPGENQTNSIFPNLQVVQGNLFLGTDFNTIGLPSLTTVGGEFMLGFVNFCPSSIEGLENLQSVGALSLEGFACSNLESLASINHITIQNFLKITGFPNLSFCSEPNICEFIQNHTPQDFVLEGNADGCNSGDQISELCIENAVTIIGTVFIDANCNGTFDTGETPYLSQQLQPIENTFIVFEDSTFSILTAPTNTINLIPLNLPSYFELYAPISLTESQLNASIVVQNVPICIAEEVSDVNISIIYFDSPRPGFTTNGAVVITNIGSIVSSVDATLNVTTANALASIEAQNEGIVNENSISWNSIVLPPSASTEVYFSVTILPDTDLLGLPLSMTALASLVGTDDINPSDNSFEISETIIGSYDPNDKTPSLGYVNLDELSNGEPIDLTYRIRFQNTGTASAINVMITDLIEENLDIQSFQMLDATHNYSYAIQGDSITWYFNNIMLPDSTSDPEGSIGQVFFRIRSTGNHDETSLIENKVSIFFDFNEPIITNTATTEFITCPSLELSLQDNSLNASEGFNYYSWYLNNEPIENSNSNILDNLIIGSYQVIALSEFNCQDTVTFNYVPESLLEYNLNELLIYPNPAVDVLNLRLPSNSLNKVMTIINSQGLIVKSTIINNTFQTINVADLASGIYLIQIDGQEARMMR